MKRTKPAGGFQTSMPNDPKWPKEVHAILGADWHLRDTVPSCRVDDFEAAMWRKLDYVAELQRQYGCPVLHAGDLLHHWKSSPYLLSKIMEHLPHQFYTVLGNHDLPQHNVDLAMRGGVETLYRGAALAVLDGVHCGHEPAKDFVSKTIKGRNILVWHIGVWQGTAPWPGCTNPTADELLEQYPQYDLIVTGDFHTPLVRKTDDGRLLVNPGSLMRQSADQIDFRPRVYLWNADTNEAVPAYLPIDRAAVSREHLDRVQDRDARLEAFVARLGTDWSVELNFEANLERFMRNNPDTVDAATRDIVYKAVDGAETNRAAP